MFCLAVRATGCWQFTATATDLFFLRKTALSVLGPKETLEGEHIKQGERIDTRQLL